MASKAAEGQAAPRCKMRNGQTRTILQLCSGPVLTPRHWWIDPYSLYEIIPPLSHQ